ncbi:MAG: hypothetical protein AAF211_25390, partial [Myxococcota bacterium]
MRPANRDPTRYGLPRRGFPSGRTSSNHALFWLTTQIPYNVTTPFTVKKTFANLVVIRNLGIAALHMLTLLQLWAIGVGRDFA